MKSKWNRSQTYAIVLEYRRKGWRPTDVCRKLRLSRGYVNQVYDYGEWLDSTPPTSDGRSASGSAGPPGESSEATPLRG